jgi:ATP synthase protein I
MNQGNDRSKLSFLRELGPLSAIGIYFGVSIALGLAIGFYLDKKLGTAPIFFLIFMILGIVAGFVNLFRLTIKQYKDNGK